MRDAITNGPVSVIPEKEGIYLSENLAVELFGTKEARGKMVYQSANMSSGLEVLGVFSDYKHYVSDKYWVNSFGLHFGIVTLITYLILLLVSLIGTIIPVVKAANILPADALRDE